jgi:thioredoxin-dependent peroxiredoxin
VAVAQFGRLQYAAVSERQMKPAGRPLFSRTASSEAASSFNTAQRRRTMTERTGAVTFQGKPLTLIGPALKAGSEAPHFVLTANDLSDLRGDAYHGKVLVICSVPSLDTPVCAVETRTFNKRATDLAKEVIVLTVSMDLPFAQKRFCGAEGIERVVTASDYKHRSFGPAFGVQIKELGLLSRAVFVLNRKGSVVHAQYVSEITQEPNYDAALAAVKTAM